MASTEPAIRSLTLADLPGCLALSLSAGWNQNEADWRAMLELGAGWGIDGAAADGSRSLAASIMVIPYGPGPGAGATAQPSSWPDGGTTGSMMRAPSWV